MKPWTPEQFRPIAPLGKKLCATCVRPMSARDRHARCQTCRRDIPERACLHCGGTYKPKAWDQQYCSRPCGACGVARRRT